MKKRQSQTKWARAAAESDAIPITRSGEDRLAQPVDETPSARLPFPVVGIGGSAGSLEAFTDFFKAMPADSGMAFVIVQHLAPDRSSLVAEILAKQTAMQVVQVEDGMPVAPNVVYVIRPGRTLTIHDGALHLGEPLEKPGHRHPIDDFFRSLAEEQRERSIAIVMSGMGSNGSHGAESIKAVGGVCIAQDPESSKYPSMPSHLIDSGMADWILKPAKMPEMLERYSRHPYATGQGLPIEDGADERQSLNEILTLLRTRVKHDFAGYKRPTLLRRIERRMGLHQIESMPGYARYLRQNPAETVALSDDLMIHVTGFFRDPDAWSVLERDVIAPLVQSRDGGPIRAWVTACSSGEEAYTLAILLAEAAERADRKYDIKIFATDTAERSLLHARSGVYAAGLEADVSPERLYRFFDRDDSMYRVKAELREMVVFAPQNILQDPPFSRLDICTCRNLLIYLEPPAQRRALELMHFGLREGGALMLGTSETVSGAEELYEAIDKKHRIYRRVGPTRHGAVEFPLGSTGGGTLGDSSNRFRPRTSVALLTNKALLERYSPPSVVIDREQRIQYFHGRTEHYLDQPRGEPTRDLLTLAREPLRGPLRTAIQQAIAGNALARVTGGWIRFPDGHRSQPVVTVSPLEQRGNEGLFLVSFDETIESDRDIGSSPDIGAQDVRELNTELHRVRAELESTIQELYASNEEMKAAHEEATSVNEEMQSTNEELETSKEELQSLNEELITVNTQLQLKMEELEGTTNDLSSLLSSTNIAVIFLDTQFRIRRFTPAVSDLVDLIQSDVGRPISDLARKFSDDALLPEARAVLEKLAPVEREIVSNTGHNYMRRILPYRTSDNRIDGVVITFVDITERAAAIAALRESEEQHRLILEGLREYGIFMMDETGHVTTWTPGAERVFGYGDREAIGKHLRDLVDYETVTSGKIEREFELARENGSATEEGWHLRKGGVQFWGSGMLAAIRGPDKRLRGYVKVLRDDTDKRLSDEALRQAKNAADAANEAKDNFLANVSHELRTPLSAILLWTNLLSDQERTSPEQMGHALAAISRSAEEQRVLIEDLVDTSRIAAGKMALDLTLSNLSSVIGAGMESVLQAARDKRISVKLDVDNDSALVNIDPVRMQQVVSNLLGNAIKFTPAGGHVWVSLQRTKDEAEFVVRDDGIGVSEEFIPHVFDRFAQSRGARSRPNDGMGLGLAIVHYIVELHGGTVTVESPGVGLGTTFTVRLHLPRTISGNPSADAVTEPVTHQRLSGQLAGVRILLVEDIDDTRQALEATLTETGAITVACNSASNALLEFQRLRPDILLSDLGLPEVDGFEFITRVRAYESTVRALPIPAIALTAFAGQNIRRKALDAGFNMCITKPIRPLALLEAIVQLSESIKTPVSNSQSTSQQATATADRDQ